MELLLALAVITAVIIFGALISIGNERQRRAIDELREQVVLWAIQDLRIKRDKLAQTAQMTDPLNWLNQMASRVCGYDLKLQIGEIFSEPQALVCTSGNGNVKFIFTPLSPNDLKQFKRIKQNRLTQLTSNSIMLFSKAKVYEMSALACGYLFDAELPLAWNALTDQNLKTTNTLWLYEII